MCGLLSSASLEKTCHHATKLHPLQVLDKGGVPLTQPLTRQAELLGKLNAFLRNR